MSQIIRQYAGKEIKLFSELFTNKNSEANFVSLFMHKSILKLDPGLVSVVH